MGKKTKIGLAALSLSVFLLAGSGVAWAQGNDFGLPPPIFVQPQPFSVPGLTGLMLPQVINNEKKSAAEVAANDYERAAIGADSAAGYWCSPAGADFFPSFGFLVCGYMAHVAASSRVYAQANRLIQRDPIDPNFKFPAEPVYLEAWMLGLWYLQAGDPAALYSNWLVDNTIAFYAWADMVRITADRAATCLLLESGSKVHCSEWQLERLWWGLQNMVDLEHELGTKILPGMRNELWSLGLQYEGDLINGISWDAVELARMLAQQ